LTEVFSHWKTFPREALQADLVKPLHISQ
jgi:hypothetical protein